MWPDRCTGRRNTWVSCLLILGGMRRSHVVRGRILGVIALNSIGTSKHISAVRELIEHGVHVGLAHRHSRVARLGLSHLGSIAEVEIFQGSGEVIHSRIDVVRMHGSECLSGERGVHLAVHVLAWSQCLTGESGGHIAVVGTCKIETSKPGILFDTV